MKFYKCEICGNQFEVLKDGGSTPVCCGKSMTELKSCSTDGAVEKHVPVYTIEEKECCPGDYHKIRIEVGSQPHPMDESHYIEWIILETDCKIYAKSLCPEKKPHAVFCIKSTETVKGVYAYCNLHGLWEAKV